MSSAAIFCFVLAVVLGHYSLLAGVLAWALGVILEVGRIGGITDEQ